jgi:hypothetical protein
MMTDARACSRSEMGVANARRSPMAQSTAGCSREMAVPGKG